MEEVGSDWNYVYTAIQVAVLGAVLLTVYFKERKPKG